MTCTRRTDSPRGPVRRSITIAALGLACLAGAGAAAVALTGCGTQSADAGDIADQIRARAEQNLSLDGATVDSVSCDKDLPATKGASATCTVKIGLGGLTATNVADVTVDSVGGDSLTFTMTPISWSAPAAYMDEAVAGVFGKLVEKERPGGTVDSASCTEDVMATKTVTTSCDVTWSDAGGKQYTQPVVVTVQKTGDIDVRVAPDR